MPTFIFGNYIYFRTGFDTLRCMIYNSSTFKRGQASCDMRYENEQNDDANDANQEGNSQTPGIPTIKVNISFGCYTVGLSGLGFNSISNLSQITDR